MTATLPPVSDLPAQRRCCDPRCGAPLTPIEAPGIRVADGAGEMCPSCQASRAA